VPSIKHSERSILPRSSRGPGPVPPR
jgi:hypothetical protein